MGLGLPIYTHILNLKGLQKFLFNLSHIKLNLCDGGSATVPRTKYPKFCLGIQLSIGIYKAYDKKEKIDCMSH